MLDRLSMAAGTGQHHAQAVLPLREPGPASRYFLELLEGSRTIAVHREGGAELMAKRGLVRSQRGSSPEVVRRRRPISLIERCRAPNFVCHWTFEQLIDLGHQRIRRPDLARVSLSHVCFGLGEISDASVRDGQLIVNVHGFWIACKSLLEVFDGS